ncbi:hypothetical protein D9757_004137 [Collybiopsis confluens]|uniref:Uncharacterized protein n=1 Tax=Collybiopsis confluens TaxID=2823264 RepID=A0A8H5MCR2_9AGAR|nr:hypothetical protein D9757_004137 [Collybiopsis confluens]
MLSTGHGVLWILLATALAATTALSHPTNEAFPARTDELLTNVTIFKPPSTYKIPRTLYARTLLLESNVLLATWENYSPEPPYFPIFRSTNGGSTWTEFSRVNDLVNGW